MAEKRRAIRKPTLPKQRTWTGAELRAKRRAESVLEDAQACAQVGNVEMAIVYCLGGLMHLNGFPRPFAVRDQISDLMVQIDPKGSIRDSIQVSRGDAEIASG